MAEFHFLRPWWFLALLPTALLLLYIWRRRSGSSGWQQVCDPELLERLWLEPPGKSQSLPLIILGLGWLLAIITLAGPVWERQPQPIYQTQASRVLILDLSASMNAPDLAPSRLARARFKLTDILKLSQEGRTALMVFAGEPHVVTPLTEDSATIANLLPALSTKIMPAAGDLAAPSLDLATELLERGGIPRGDLLLITDGMGDTAATLRKAHALRKQGHRLSVLAVGTAQGAPLKSPSGGFSGMARLNTAPLEELAKAGGGTFSLISNDNSDLARVLLPPPQAASLMEEQEGGVDRWVEQGAWLIPLLLLLAAGGFRRGWLAGLLVIAIMPPPANALTWADLWLRNDQQAAQTLAQGDAKTAAERFQDPAWRGTALYQAGDYEAAAQAFAENEGPEADYNRGNALAKAGQLDQAATAYRQTLEQNPNHADAKANLELVEKLMEQQQSQQQNQDNSPEEGEEGENQEQEGDQKQDGQDSPQKQQSDNTQQSQSEEQNSEQQEEQASESPQNQTARKQEEPSTSDPESEAQAAKEDVMPQDQTEEPEQQQPMPAMEPSDETPSEADIALEQWLQQIPEDPSGLLRRKFMLDHLRRQQEGNR